MKTLLDILEQNKAQVSFQVGESAYSEYYAHISFEDSKVRVNVFDDEGGHYGDEEEPMPFEWIEKIYKVVNELKEAKHLPEFTLNLIEEK
jgi:hypothetical protein